MSLCVSISFPFFRPDFSQNMTFYASKVTFQLSELRDIWCASVVGRGGPVTNLSSPGVLVDGYNVKC